MQREQRRWLKKTGIKRGELECHNCGKQFEGLIYGPERWNHDHYCETCTNNMAEVDGIEYSLSLRYEN